jgi:hypothetical protein
MTGDLASASEDVSRYHSEIGRIRILMMSTFS